jgi:ER-bound oxygenase mpaB/B'/Rubber oxygenase, catalytic domain
VTVPSFLELELLRNVGDDLADNAVAAFFAEVERRTPGELFGQLVRHVKLPEEAQLPAIRKYLAEAGRQPDWIDPAAVARGQEFFNRLVIHQFTALYLSSLPNSYAAAKGVQVLRLTGRLQTDTMRRLNETGQFLMDIAAPKAMDEGGIGIDRIVHVRLMHAAVRWMILHDQLVTRVTDLAPSVTESDELVWSSSWGIPANQEDLLGTWLTFTGVVYDAFDASGVDYSEQNLADHLHLWRLVAHYLGIEPDLIPRNRSDANVLRERIFGSHRRLAALETL